MKFRAGDRFIETFSPVNKTGTIVKNGTVNNHTGHIRYHVRFDHSDYTDGSSHIAYEKTMEYLFDGNDIMKVLCSK